MGWVGGGWEGVSRDFSFAFSILYLCVSWF